MTEGGVVFQSLNETDHQEGVNNNTGKIKVYESRVGTETRAKSIETVVRFIVYKCLMSFGDVDFIELFVL